MATSINTSTGDRMATKPASEKYRNNWDAIFGKKKQEEVQQEQDNEVDDCWRNEEEGK